MKNLVVISIFYFVFALYSIAQTTSATSSGSWEVGGTWNNGVPACGSHTNIVIRSGVTVSIKNSTIDLTACDVTITIESGGTLELERTGNGGNISFLDLGAASSIIVESGAQITAVTNKPSKISTIIIDIGGVNVWDGSDGNITTAGIINGASVNGSQTPLPVELISFEAIPKTEEVVLLWITASEINNDFFEIQRSRDGNNFEIIGDIEGQGNKNTPTEYSFTDKEPLSGLTFYRLRQTDFDGKFEVSQVVSVSLDKPTTFEVEVFPNPLNGHNLYLKIPKSEGEDFQIFVNDLLGKDYITDLTFIEQDGFTMVILELSSNLPAGYYFVNIQTQDSVISKKVIVK